MLTYEQLVELERSLGDERVLSVYVDGRSSDPASRDQWRRLVDDELRELRRATGAASREEREALEKAVGLLVAQFPIAGGALGSRGWAGFFTAGGVVHASPLPVRMPTRVSWTLGPQVAPYVRALKQLRPVYVAVADNVRARLYRYVGGALERLETLESERHDRAPAHMGSMPRVGFHTGTRGAAGVDEAERRRLAVLAHEASTVAARLVALAGADGWIVIGGTPEAARAVRRALPIAMSRLALLLPSLHDGATDADVLHAAEEGASQLRDARDLGTVSDVLERAGGAGRAAAGVDATRRALADRRVDEVFLSDTFLERDADVAESVVRAALAQHAAVEEVSGAAAERLDRDGGGIAARLRFGRGGGKSPFARSETPPSNAAR